MMKKYLYTSLLISFYVSSLAQVITPFTIAYEVTQKGGIRYISNSSVTCSGIGCTAGRIEVPPGGTSTNNAFTAAYADIDADGSTFSSSSDSLELPSCSEISWAGLFWGGEITNAAANYAVRNQCRVKLNNGTYTLLTADALQDNATGFDTYHCFKDITSIVKSAGGNARFTVANVAARVGGTNRFGGWTIVVVYKNDNLPMRNLTVFKGLSHISGANPVTDITASGFLTPLSGPVTFEVGAVSYDGDRSSTGDQLMFNGGNGFVNISDAVNPLNDIFNSTYSYNGVQKGAPFIIPAYSNGLGYDADIFVPNNAAKNYLGNSATSATLRLTTGGETFLTQVVTMAIDVYEPDPRATVRVTDLNGGSVLPGDILEYTIRASNIGSDPSVNTFVTDTLERNLEYVPGSLEVIFGPNTGTKTDAAGDDQAEYISALRTVRVRIGTGANAVTGGQVNNSTTGADSTQIRFRAIATTDCIVLTCDNIVNQKATMFVTGNVSGNSFTGTSTPGIKDGAGCWISGTTNTPISSAGCTSPAASSNTPVCTGKTINLTTTPSSSNATYSWTGPGGFVSSAANPTRANATIAMAGTYTVVISVPGTSCSYTVTTVVAINTTPATPSPSSNTPVCGGNTINLSTAAVAGATYSWTGPSSFSSALQNPTRTNATTAMAGTYSVTVTANGCTSATGTTVMVVNSTPATPSPSSNTPLCTGNTINLSTPAVAGATYSWTGPASFSSSVQNPTRTNATTAMAGTYSVTVTANGCTSGAGTTVVVVNTTPSTPTASSNTPVCAGNTINLSTPAVAGATYSWTGPNSFTSSVQNPTITNATTAMAGTYSVTVTTNGCTSASGTTVMVVNSTPVTPSPSSNSPRCAGNTINLSTPAVAGATYSWTGPNSFASSVQNPTITNATTAMAGTYSVTVTANGCTSGAGTTVVVVNTTPSTPTASSNTPVCAGNTINLSTPAAAGATYSWTGPNSFTSSVQNPTITNATVAMAGTYSVTVTTNGCTSASGTTAVVVNTTPATPTASSNSPVCAGNTINLSTPAVAGATYSWTGPSSFTSAVQNPTRTNATVAMAGTYSVTVTANGCTSGTGTTVMVVNATPATPTASSNSPVCAGNTINLSTPAVAGATYSWTGPNSFTSSAQNPTITNATTAMAGTYSVTVTANGCTSGSGTTAVVVNTTPATPTASSNSPVCAGNTINLSTPAVAGATYSWTGPSSFTSSVQNPTRTNATVAMAGTYSVTVTTNGCTSGTGTTVMVVNATPATPTASSNSPVCTGNTINLSTPAVAGATYTWTGPNAFTSSVQNPTITNATVAMAGTYSVTVTANGCTSGSGTTAVVVNATPATPTASSNSPVCAGNTINLSTPAVAGATYSWTGPNAFVSSVQNPTITNATVAMAGTYSITVTINGCASSNGTTIISVTASPSIALVASVNPSCNGGKNGSVSINASGGTGIILYDWTPGNPPGDGTNTITGLTAGTYSVTVSDANSCTATQTFILTEPAAITNEYSETACDSYTWNSQTYTTSGDYIQVLKAANTCDSTVTLHLTIKPSSKGSDVQTACDSYKWIDGVTYTSSNNTATHTLKNAAGCDSVVTLNLTINYTTKGTDVKTACDSYKWIDGITYTSSNNTATHTLKNAAGCDSVVTLNLTINYPTKGTDVKTACNSFTWIDGITYTSSNNTATHTLKNAAGCDSVVTLNLTINYSTKGTDVKTACNSFTWIDGVTYTSSNNTATHTLKNAAGCDSVVTLDLTINYPTKGTDVKTACNSFTWIDGITYTSSNNTATHTLKNAVGCDSVVTLNLTINYSTTGTDVKIACDSYTWIDGVTYTSSNNTATHTLKNAVGCDSVVTLNLTINYPTKGTDVKTACNSFTWIDGVTYTSSNTTATHTLKNAAGCDSVVTLNLTINYPTKGTDVKTACNSFTWIDGVTYTSSNNTATHTLKNAAGCDSVVTLNLTINYPTKGTDVKTACNSFTWIDGVTYTSSNNTATHTLKNAAGCDSVVTLNLTINTVDVSVSLSGNVLTAGATGAVYQWIDCNGNVPLSGETGQTFTVGTNGNYAVVVTQNNCTDTSICTNVIVTAIADNTLNSTFINVYPNPNKGHFVIELSTTAQITIYNVLGKVILDERMPKGKNQLNLSELLTGVYYIRSVTDNKQQVVKITINRL